MDLRHLRYFVTVAEERSVSRAATRLRVAQPALSRQIHALERELGLELLARQSAGVELTSVGESIASSARVILAQAESIVRRAADAAHGLTGRLVIGVGRSAWWLEIIQPAEAAIRERLPDVELEIREVEPGPEQFAQLSTGALDLAIGLRSPVTTHDFAWAALYDVPFDCAIVPIGTPLASLSVLRPEDLATVPLLFPRAEWHPDSPRVVDETLRQLGIRPPLNSRYSGPKAVWLAVGSGAGWTLWSRQALQMSPAGTVAIPVEGLHVTMATGLMWRASEARPHALRAIETIRGGSTPLNGASPRGDVLRGLELRQLRALATVIQSESLGRAAQRLRLTPPALSRQLRDLEREIGVQLITKGAKGTAPTHAGLAAATDALRVLTTVDALTADAARMRNEMSMRCVIGAVATNEVGKLLGVLLRETAVSLPAVRIVIEDVPTPRQRGELLAGTIDLSIGHVMIGAPLPASLARKQLSVDRIDSALIAEDHPLASHRTLTADDLRDAPFLFMERGYQPEFYDQIMQALARIGIVPRVETTVNSIQVLWRLTAEGRGWTLGFLSQSARVPRGTVRRPLVGLTIPWGLEVLWRRDEPKPAARAVRALLRHARRKRAP
ncbi:MAG TPA: LysR substrate-binding domain-containing protein [Gemmatimonadaceae bacterium]|nr:LysR substrate-binding domain-containing protein [Gemmatimonadaceae bacterium]